jgi:energy-coupling factor transporter transmembrane protein EcfT
MMGVSDRRAQAVAGALRSFHATTIGEGGNPTMNPGTNPSEAELIRQLNTPIHSAKGWIKFLAVLMIVYGVITALTLVGLLIAWLPIWMGVVLWQAAQAADQAQIDGDRAAFLRAQYKLKTYFVITGVLALVMLVVAVAQMGMFGVGLLMHGFEMPGMEQALPPTG